MYTALCCMNRFTNSPIANYRGRLYNLPFNMNTFYQLWGVQTPQEAMARIAGPAGAAGIGTPKNLEERPSAWWEPISMKNS